jgi:N-acetylmuramoyl-L-alanine amidase
MWPSRDYTRLTIESKTPVKYEVLSVSNPDRIVLDLETDITPPLSELDGKAVGEDPYVKGLRVARNRPGVVRVVLDLKTEVRPEIFTLAPVGEYGHARNRPGVVRVVLDLKTEVRPEIFTLAPVGEYGHRIVLDIRPVVEVDPLAQLLEESGKNRPAPAREQPAVARLATIVIDAGHGGEDPGALGRRGTREKDVTLMIARRLKALIDNEPNMRAMLTRDGDYFIPLDGRVEKARKVKADLLVSIHADSYKRSSARGSSVFALSDRRATSELARLLAQKENESDLIGGVKLDGKDDYVKKTIIDLSQTATIDYSLRLGNSVLAKLASVNQLHKGRVEQASFAVLKSPDVPSILVETAFISNPDEEKRLKDRRYQDQLARAILDGIRDYVAKHPPRPASPLALN